MKVNDVIASNNKGTIELSCSLTVNKIKGTLTMQDYFSKGTEKKRVLALAKDMRDTLGLMGFPGQEIMESFKNIQFIE